MQGGNQVAYMDFYPRPPRGGRHHADMLRLELYQISIHALREEGDSITVLVLGFQRYFYPRPPRGGRPNTAPAINASSTFLSTPSARRATFSQSGSAPRSAISIHALREEGDFSL